MKTTDTLKNIGLLIVRIGTASFMLTHGWPKFQQLISAEEIRFGDPIGLGPMASLILAAFAEFFCSILIGLGIKTRIAAIPPLITMLVAAFIAHADDPFSGKEKSLLYALLFIALIVFGGGKYSLDSLIGRKKGI